MTPLRREILRNCGLVFLHFWKAVVLSLVDGAVVAIGVAAVVGFVAWLAGAADPRSVALVCSLIVGSLWSAACLLRWCVKIALAGQEAYARLKIQRALDGLEEQARHSLEDS